MTLTTKRRHALFTTLWGQQVHRVDGRVAKYIGPVRVRPSGRRGYWFVVHAFYYTYARRVPFLGAT